MNKFPPRRFLTNFNDGTAEFNDDATPPAQEYVSLIEYEDTSAQLAEATKDPGAIASWLEGLSRHPACPSERRFWYEGVAADIRNGAWKLA